MNISISIPFSSFKGSEDKEFRKAFKALLVKYLAQEISPDYAYNNMQKNDIHFKVSITDNDYLLLQQIAEKHHVAVGNVAAGIVYAGNKLNKVDEVKSAPSSIEKPSVDIKSASLSAYLTQQGKNESKEQIRLSNNIYEHFEKSMNESMLFTEAATGVGKGAVIVSTAMDLAIKHKEPIVVCAPTFRILNQLIKEHNSIQDKLGIEEEKQVPFSLIHGKGEFVSSALIQQFLDEFKQSNWITTDAENSMFNELEFWLAAGGPDSDESVVKKFFTISGMQYHCPSVVDPEQFSVLNLEKSPQSETDAGLLSYKDQFFAMDGGMVFYCTHATVALDLLVSIIAVERILKNDSLKAEDRTKLLNEYNPNIDWNTSTIDEIRQNDEIFYEYLVEIDEESDIDSILPVYKYMLIDDSHLFEQIVNTAFTKGFALHTLKSSLGKNGFESEAMEISKKYISAIAKIGYTHCFTDYDENLLRKLRDYLSAVKAKVNNKTPKTQKNKYARLLRILNNDIATMNMVIKNLNNGAINGFAKFSPVKNFPTIHAGKNSTRRELSFLWSGKRVVLFSATSYVPSIKSDEDETYLDNILALPEYTRHLPSIRPSWLTSPVTLVKSNKPIPQLTPPSYKKYKDNEEGLLLAKQAWIAETAKYIYHARQSSAGGIIVLTTSYESAAETKLQLSKMVEPSLIITSEFGKKMEDMTKKFVKFSHLEAKPIWIAVGQSWTGVDISGRNIVREIEEVYDSSKDNIFTDLIIPKLPFGLNHSISHTIRARRYFNFEVCEMMIMLIQGFGRLVRANGIPSNRRIHLLDQRFHDDSLKSIRTPLLYLFNRYNKQANITVDENGHFIVPVAMS